MTAVLCAGTLAPVLGRRGEHLSGEGEIDALQELSGLLEVIETLREQLERPGIDTASTAAELEELAVRLRESQARLTERKPVDRHLERHERED